MAHVLHESAGPANEMGPELGLLDEMANILCEVLAVRAGRGVARDDAGQRRSVSGSNVVPDWASRKQ